MSAAFKLAKKKVSQHDLRRIMQEQKQSRGSEDFPKVDSPFAKYDDDNYLNCQLCKKRIANPKLWKVHVNSKQHKDNILHAKMLKEKLENHVKPPVVPTIQERVANLKERKLKGILKNSSATAAAQVTSSTAAIEPSSPEPTTSKSAIPDDFFDAKKKPETNGPSSSAAGDDKMQVDDAIPEGFFDDAKKDAKARNVEYKNPIEEEWDKFQKEIKEAQVESVAIINEEQEVSTVERQIDEIDAQIKNWSR